MGSTDTATTDIVVAGGGIGGLSNAYALTLAGHRVTVLEQAPAFNEVGAGLQLAPNATRILKSWGMLDEVIERGFLPRQLVLRDALDASDLTSLDLGPAFVERYGAPYVVIHRSDLLEILLEGCRRVGVELHTDSKVDGCEAEDDAALALVGERAYPGRLVIAADGIYSRLRSRIIADETIQSDYVAYRGVIPLGEAPDTEHLLTDSVVAYIGPRCHLVQYPLRGGEVLNQVAVFKASPALLASGGAGGPSELFAAYAHCHPAVRNTIGSLWHDRFWSMYDREPTPCWVAGRLVLTGDAAHPMLQYLAQGACQAIEDAATLATELDAASDWDVGLASYQDRRAARTARIQRTAREWGEIWHCDGLARSLRNGLFRRRRPDDYADVDWLYARQHHERV